MLADDLAAVAVEHDERGGTASAPAARLAERVRRQVGGVDGSVVMGAFSTTSWYSPDRVGALDRERAGVTRY
jgi:hypothetical protein